MKITPKIDDRRLRKKLDQQIRENPRQIQIALGRTAEFLMGVIKTRTQRGKDADGRKHLGEKKANKYHFLTLILKEICYLT